MLQVMTFSIGVIESDTVSTSNMPPLPLCENLEIQNQLYLPGEFCPKAAELEDGYDLFVQDGEVLLLISIHDHL